VFTQTLVRCIAKGTGTNLAVTVSTGVNQTTVSSLHVSFKASNCPLQCPTGSYPDSFCERCYDTASQCEVPDEATVSYEDFMNGLTSEIEDGQLSSDQVFLTSAVRYQGNQIGNYNFPRYLVDSATFGMKMGFMDLKIGTSSGTTDVLMKVKVKDFDEDTKPLLVSSTMTLESFKYHWTKVLDNTNQTRFILAGSSR